MCFSVRSSSSVLHCSQVSLMLEGRGSSQPIFNSHIRCSRISILINEGENHLRTLKVLAISDTRSRFVRFSDSGNSATVRRKWSRPEFHWIPRVFVYSSGSGIGCTDWLSLSSGGTCCRTKASLEFHFRNRNLSQEKSSWSCLMTSSTVSPPMRPSST